MLYCVYVYVCICISMCDHLHICMYGCVCGYVPMNMCIVCVCVRVLQVRDYTKEYRELWKRG